MNHGYKCKSGDDQDDPATLLEGSQRGHDQDSYRGEGGGYRGEGGQGGQGGQAGEGREAGREGRDGWEAGRGGGQETHKRHRGVDKFTSRFASHRTQK